MLSMGVQGCSWSDVSELAVAPLALSRCGPCRMIAPLIDELAGEYSGRLKCVVGTGVYLSPSAAASDSL